MISERPKDAALRRPSPKGVEQSGKATFAQDPQPSGSVRFGAAAGSGQHRAHRRHFAACVELAQPSLHAGNAVASEVQPDRGQAAIAIQLVAKAELEAWQRGLSTGQRAAAAAQKFAAAPGELAIVPEGEGWFAALGVADPAAPGPWCLAKAAESLPGGVYRLAMGAAVPCWRDRLPLAYDPLILSESENA